MARYFARIFLLTALIVAAAQAPTFAEETEQLEVVNGTHQSIKALYIVPSDYHHWGNDLAGSHLIEPGQNRFTRYDPAYRFFKVRMVLFNGGAFVWENDAKVDLSDAWRITIYYDGAKYRISKNSVG